MEQTEIPVLLCRTQGMTLWACHPKVPSSKQHNRAAEPPNPPQGAGLESPPRSEASQGVWVLQRSRPRAGPRLKKKHDTD